MTHPAPADPSDLIVGSWRAPQSLRRLPAVVWLFAAAALGDLVVRAVTFGATFESAQSRPGDSLILVLSGLPAAAYVLLPGAVLLGTWHPSAKRRVFIGAALLAIAELVSAAVTAVVFGRFAGNGPLDAFDLFARMQAVDGVTLIGQVCSLAGVWVLTLAVAQIRPRGAGSAARSLAGLVLAIALAGALAGAATQAKLIGTYTASPDPLFGSGFITLPTLVANGIGIAAGIGWGALAAVGILGSAGASARRRSWILLSAAATIRVISVAIAEVVTVVGANGPTDVTAQVGLAMIQFGSTASTIGVGCLLAALAIGLGAAPHEPPRIADEEANPT